MHARNPSVNNSGRQSGANTSTTTLSNEVGCDEASVIAGHKGQLEVVKLKGHQGRQCRLIDQGGRSSLETERLSVCGMMQRGGQVVTSLWAHVQQKTFAPFIT